jgi:hypothetical protein
MAIFGYARVSTRNQDVAAQVAELMTAGCAKVYREKASGAKTDRPELGKIIGRLEPGDNWMPSRPPGVRASATLDQMRIRSPELGRSPFWERPAARCPTRKTCPASLGSRSRQGETCGYGPRPDGPTA